MKKLLLSLFILGGFYSNAQTVLFEDSFEFYDDFAIENVGDWTLTDVDGLIAYTIGNGTAYTWPGSAGTTKSFQVFNAGAVTLGGTPVAGSLVPGTAASNWTARTGDRHMVCFAGQPSVTVTANNDWLISPQITLGTGNVVKFWAKPCSTQYGAEKFKVSVSSTGTAVTDFVKISAGASITTPVNTTWVEYTYTIPASYNNLPVYVAITCVSDDQYGFGVDDFKVEGTVLATENFFTSNYAVYPNPAYNVLNINAKTNIVIADKFEITDMNGRTVKEVKGMTNQINISELNAGVYFLKVTSSQGTGTTKIIKK